MTKLDEIYKKMEFEKFQRAEIERIKAIESEKRRREFVLAEQRLYEKFIITTAPPATTGGKGGQKNDTDCGCIQFDLNKYIIVDPSNDFNLGSNDFTIEWFQYQLNGSPYPRVFQFGAWPSRFGVSIESGDGEGGGDGYDYIFYFWINQGESEVESIPIISPLNSWTHFAISRINNTTRIYMNGTKIDEFSFEYTINVNSVSMHIGVDPLYSETTYFTGGISNFRFINGTGLYQNDAITVPTSVLQPVENTILLLQTKTSDTFLSNSGTSKVITNNGATWNTGNPFKNTY